MFHPEISKTNILQCNADIYCWFMTKISVINGPIHMQRKLVQSAHSSLSTLRKHGHIKVLKRGDSVNNQTK